MSEKQVQILSFDSDNSSKLKTSQTHHGFNVQAKKRKELSETTPSKYDQPLPDDRSNEELMAKLNKKQKRMEMYQENKQIKNSQHNRLEGGIMTQDLNKIKNNTHRAHMKTNEQLARQTALQNIQFEQFIQPTEVGQLTINDPRGILTTRHLTQDDLYQQASATIQQKAFHLRGLQYGAYFGDYTRNGQYLLLCGSQGHVNILDWRNGKSLLEQNVQEEIKDACFLQDHTLYALAQKKYVCLYDGQGKKIHHLKTESMQFPTKLQFLPYHYLLVTGTQTGMLSWRDVTTGEIVESKVTKKGPVISMRQNPSNAVIHVGHNSGLVTLWTPNMAKPVVTINAVLNGAVNDLCIDESGRYMYTCGSEGTVKLWDIRNYQTISTISLGSPIDTCDVSQNGLVAFGTKGKMSIFTNNEFIAHGQKMDQRDVRLQHRRDRQQEKAAAGIIPTKSKTEALTHSYIDSLLGVERRKKFSLDTFKTDDPAPPQSQRQEVRQLELKPFLRETFPGHNLRQIRFIPYEDLIGVGINGTYRQCIIPGAGNAHFDSWEANPFETQKQRQERIVKGLLEKLQPDMITLDTHAFNVMANDDAHEHHQRQLKSWNNSTKHDVDLEKKRMKGRSSIKNAIKRKKIGIVEEKAEKMEEYLQEKKEKQREKKKQELKQQQAEKKAGVVKSALDRFL